METSYSKLTSAFCLAAHQHKHLKRKNKDKDPYINHPLEVAHLCAVAGCTDEDVLIAAVLHDTVEDTGLTCEEIEKQFGSKVCQLVCECTDDKKLDKVTRKKLQIEHAQQISDGAKLIKLADKYSNLKELQCNPPTLWSGAQIHGYMCWSFAVWKHLKSINNKYFDDLFDKLWKPFVQKLDLFDESLLNQELEKYYKVIENQE